MAYIITKNFWGRNKVSWHPVEHNTAEEHRVIKEELLSVQLWYNRDYKSPVQEARKVK